MKCKIICTGNELLSGSIENTNNTYISKKLVSYGTDIINSVIVNDDVNVITDTISASLPIADCILLIGGLGPTFDDVTRNAISKCINEPLILKEELLDDIKEHFTNRGLKFSNSNIKQAMVPRKTKIIPNELGTAAGLRAKYRDTYIIAMPGVPKEMKKMFDDYVMPFLIEEYNLNKNMYEKKIAIYGLPESAVNETVKKLIGDKRITYGITTEKRIVTVRISIKIDDELEAQKMINRVIEYLCKEFSDNIVSYNNETLEEIVVMLLKLQHRKLSIVESCTGGLVSNFITNVPGVSRIYRGGMIAYDNEIKISRLNISEKILSEYGAVSQECVEKMLVNQLEIFKSNVGIAVSGILGPDSDNTNKPVGLVYTGIIIDGKTYIEKNNFSGNRLDIKEQIVYKVLNQLRLVLIG